MRSTHRLGEPRIRPSSRGRTAALVAAAGLAAGLTADALAITMPLIRSRLRTLSLESFTGGAPASTVVVANMDGGHVWETHEAFAGRVTRVWWNGDKDNIIGALRGTFFSAHATAAASAMATDSWTIPDPPIGIVPPRVEGFARQSPVILSAAFATGVNFEGRFTGETNLAKAFTIFALTDPMVAGFASNQLGIPPYPVATVVNASFGSTQTNFGRMGESITAHAFDAAVVRTDAVIVVAAGDEELDPILEQQRNEDPNDPGGAVGEPASAYNVLTVGRVDDNFSSADENSSDGRIGVVDWRGAGATMLSSINAQEFPMGCPQPSSLTEQLTAARPAVHLAAPGTLVVLAGSQTIDPPTIAPDLADTAFSAFWSGTSLSSAIVAGVAAQLQDIGNKANMWPTDDAGNVIGRGLATRAILINAADDERAMPQVETSSSTTGADAGACVFTRPLGRFLGAGLVSPERVRLQLLANQVRDVREGNLYLVDGLHRPLLGVSRSNFMPEPDDPRDVFRDDPPLLTGQALSDTVTNAATPPAQDWKAPWDIVNQLEGTPADRPFATVVLEPVDPSGLGGIMAPPEGPVDDAPAGTLNRPRPVEFDAEVQSKPYGQPGLEGRPDVNLEFERPSLGGGGNTGVIPGSFEGGGGSDTTSDGGSSFIPRKTGWDIGRMGHGVIDYPLGVITPGSDIRATLVWNRTEVWSDGLFESWQTISTAQDIKTERAIVRSAVQANDPNNSYPPQEMSSDVFRLPDAQVAFALENLDLELWMFDPGAGNRLIAASRHEWSPVEHISVGDEALCTTTQELTFGNYFLRVRYNSTQFDFGGYRFCGGVQSQQLVRPGVMTSNDPPPGQLYRNLYPSETPFAIAWRVDIQPTVGFQQVQAFQQNPEDLTSDGVVDDDDMQALVSIVRGDLNGDGRINGGDIAVLLNQMGGTNSLYDLSGDGAVTSADLSHLLARFGETF